jgi:hypothetical protein
VCCQIDTPGVRAGGVAGQGGPGGAQVVLRDRALSRQCGLTAGTANRAPAMSRRCLMPCDAPLQSLNYKLLRSQPCAVLALQGSARGHSASAAQPISYYAAQDVSIPNVWATRVLGHVGMHARARCAAGRGKILCSLYRLARPGFHQY